MSKLIIKIGGSFLTKKAQSGDFPTTVEGIISHGEDFIETKRLESAAREIVDVAERLISRGYTDSDVRKVLGENFLRVFDQVWG